MTGRDFFSLPAAFLGIGLLILAAGQAHGSGFGIFVQGASALGRADAAVAHLESPSAVFFNPALLTRLPGTQLELGTTLVAPDRDFRSDLTGRSEGGDRAAYFPSTLYVSHAVNDQLSLGLGVFNPFGLGTDWPDDWEGRYIATESQITTYNINPVVAWRVNPRVSVAAGISYLLLDAELENKINSTALAGILAAQGFIPPQGLLPDSGQKFEGDGDGWGYNLGLAVDLTDRLTFGASYRSEIEVDIDGDVSFALVSPLLAGALPDSDGKTTITLPQQVFAGLAFRPTDRLTLEGGLRWEGWSSFDQLKIRFAQPALGESVQPRDWKDTFTYMAGTSYRLTDRIALLAGYLYGENPIPSGTFEPAIPDSDSHLFCLGTDLDFNRLRLSVAYSYQYLEERKKNNGVGDPLGTAIAGFPTGTANGTYDSEIHMVGVSMTYRY